MKLLITIALLSVVGYTAWWCTASGKCEPWLDGPPINDEASFECEYGWENFRVLRPATTPYISSDKQSGFTVVYYEQVIGGDRHLMIGLYQGPKSSWNSCQEKLGQKYANTVDLGISDYPYAIVISEGTVTMLYTRDKRRARRLEDLPIIGTRKDAYYIEDLEAQDKPGRP